jgi:two-component sensor histidine kinase
MVIESAADRMQRILVIAVGLGSAAFTLIGLSEIIAAQSRLAIWYTIPVYVLFLGIPPLLASLAYAVSPRALRVPLIAHALFAVLTFVAWIPATLPGVGPTDAVPWIQNIFAIACSSAALVLPYSASIAYTIVLAALSGIVRFFTYGGGDPSAALQDALYGMLFCATLVTLLQLARRAASLQDEATDAAEIDATRTTAAEALERQRRRYQDFIRDEVRGVLQAALSTGGVRSAAMRDDASRVLHALTELQSERAAVTSVDVQELRQLLEQSAENRVSVGLSTSGSVKDLLVPFDTADALASAFAEAVRNSFEHAGETATKPVLRRAWITASPNRIEIVVSDSGVGFNPTRIPIDRMGVRVGILGALERVPGAKASISSSRGRGATVQLVWEVPGS